jgi:hypothetical protein
MLAFELGPDNITLMLPTYNLLGTQREKPISHCLF